MYKYNATKKIILGISVIIIGCFYGVGVLAYVPIVANAGPDQYLNHDLYNTNLTTVLQGSGKDPNGGSLIFYWTCNSGSLSDPNIARPVFTAANTSQTSYNCALRITDTYGLSNSDTMTVYLNSNSNTNNPRVQTNPATKVNNNGATLNGYFNANDITSKNYVVWFQWGPTASYGAQTSQLAMASSGSFSQNLVTLTPGTTYHVRAVAQKQNNGQMYYGQEVTFYNNAPAANIVLASTSSIQGTPTDVSTGLTNNFLTDSFFLPLLIAIIGVWMFMQGFFVDIEEWIYRKKGRRKDIRAKIVLENKIAGIKKIEKIQS